MAHPLQRVRGDEYRAALVDLDVGALELQLVLPGLEALLDGEDLLRDHRQDLRVDAVELVEAAPRPAARQTLQELGERPAGQRWARS